MNCAPRTLADRPPPPPPCPLSLAPPPRSHRTKGGGASFPSAPPPSAAPPRRPRCGTASGGRWGSGSPSPATTKRTTGSSPPSRARGRESTTRSTRATTARPPGDGIEIEEDENDEVGGGMRTHVRSAADGRGQEQTTRRAGMIPFLRTESRRNRGRPGTTTLTTMTSTTTDR